MVETAPGRLAEVNLAAVQLDPSNEREVTSGLTVGDGAPVEADTRSIAPSSCDGCSNYGPKGEVPDTQGRFQQFALRHGRHPWSGGQPGWYCMSCSMPPR